VLAHQRAPSGHAASLKLYVAQLHAQPILVGDTALIVAAELAR
jgi:hypothetical protein